jgi:hypothetical protein
VPEEAAGTLGRATGVEDRGQRSIVAYDERGNAIWTARQMAIIPTASGLATAPGSGNYPDVTETAPFGADVTYDTAHRYEQSSEYDYANRGRRLLLPRDPCSVPLPSRHLRARDSGVSCTDGMSHAA